MEDNTRISVVGIIIEDRSSAEQVNELLHQYGDYIAWGFLMRRKK